MRRIQDTNVGPGPTFISRDPGTNTPGTIIRRAWMNDTQEELCGMIESAGIVVDTTDYGVGTGDRTQIAQGISHYGAGGGAFYKEAAGSLADAYIFESIDLGITSRLSPPTIFDGMEARGDIAAPNSGGPATLNVNGFGPIAIKTLAGADPIAGEVSGRPLFIYHLLLNSWVLTSGTSGGGSGQIGETLIWDIPSTPLGNWLRKDGSAVSRVTYAGLFALYGVAYGIGDGVTTFNLPDDEGYFYRIQDNGSGIDPDAAGRGDRGDGTTGDNVGTKQGYNVQSHDHGYTKIDINGPNDMAGTVGLFGNWATTTDATGGNETRSINKYVTAWVRY